MSIEKSRKKIVFVLPSLAGGGAERVLIALMNGLDGKQFEKALIAVSDDGPLRDLIAQDIPFYTLGRGLKASRSVFKLYACLKRLQPDIVVSTMAHMNFALLLLRPFFPKTRFVVREAVTPSYFFQRKSFKEAIVWFGYKVLYPLADIIISPAQIIIDEFRRDLKSSVKRHVLLPNPVDVEKIRAGKSPALDDRVQFICSGRLHPQKGFDRLIEVLPVLTSDWHLTILGEGEQREELQARIKALDLSDRVTFAGFVKQPWPMIAAADAFLLPSRYEGLPNVVLESLACGTPVIAMKDAGGIDEIAAHTQAKDLKVVNTMQEFLEAIQGIKRCPAEGYRDSLLPELYKKQNVIARFTEILVKDNT